MSQRTISWRHITVVGAISLLAACTQTPQHAGTSTPPHAVASNPPPVAPASNAIWHTVSFDSDSKLIDAKGEKVISEVITYMQHNPGALTTIIGRTDTVGSKDYNMHLSHQRADAVRDALVYNGKIAADRVETRWTGEARQDLPTGNEVAASENRVVDIAIHQ